MKSTTIVSFYELASLKDYKKLGRDIERLGFKLKILGTFISTPQGINTTLSGSKKDLLELVNLLRNNYGLDIECLNWSESNKTPFKRFKVRFKDQILPLEGSFDPLKERGRSVEPIEWNDLINDSDTLLIDVRNEYETNIGSFRRSINPLISNFTEFKDFVETNSPDLKEKNIAMYCTGGIRCEIASSFLIEQGFKDVFQLKGGVLNYLEKVKKEDQLWEGECFVFDERVSVDRCLDEGNYMQCFGCRRPLSEDDQSSVHYVKGVSCPYCHNISSEEDKTRFAQRQKQIELAEARGFKHLGQSARK